MAAALRANWAAPAEPQELPPREPPEQQGGRPVQQSRPAFGARGPSANPLQEQPQPLALLQAAHSAPQLGRQITLDRSAWAPALKKSNTGLAKGQSSEALAVRQPPSKANSQQPQQRQQQRQLEDNRRPIEPEDPEEEEAPPGPCMAALDKFGEALLDFCADWFSAVHLQHLSAHDVTEKHPSGAAAKEVLDKVRDSGSRFAGIVNPKLKKNQKTLASTLLSSLTGSRGSSSADSTQSPVTQLPSPSQTSEVTQPPEEDPDEEPAAVLKRECGMQLHEPAVVRQHYPVFSIGQCVFVFCLWAICSLSSGKETAGFETIFPGKTDLSLQFDCVDYRAEMLWRWWTHQFTHVGFTHVFMNCLMVLIFGVSLEGLHGWWRMFLMFNVGVFGGACCYMVFDVHTRVVGMSGGCYALVGMHFGDILLNWQEQARNAQTFKTLAEHSNPGEDMTETERIWRKMTIPPKKKFLALVIVVAIDLIQASFTMGTGTSHTVHSGGAVAGFLICIVVGVNIVVEDYEEYFWHGALAAGVALVIFCISWGMSWPPRDAFDTTPWCWGRQVANATIFKDNNWHCVRCADHACIARWSVQRHIELVTDRVCRKGLGWEITER